MFACFAVGWLVTSSVYAKPGHVADVAQLKSICRGLIGSQFPYDGLPWQRPWKRLLPYLRSKDDLYRGPLVCSGGCSGSVKLRDGFALDFSFINPQKFGQHWRSNDGLIDSVTLWDGSKILLRYPKT